MHYFPNSQQIVEIQMPQNALPNGAESVETLLKILHLEVPTTGPMGGGLLEELKERERKKGKDLLAELIAQMLAVQSASNVQQQIQINPPNFHSNFHIPTSPISMAKMQANQICGQMQINWKKAENDKEIEGKEAIGQFKTSKNKKKFISDEETVERPHRCDQCQKSFRFKSNLFEHKSLHLATGHRNPFVCPFCAKTCRLKGNLKKHLQVHVTSVEDLERLWKRSFSRQSGRPRKNAPPAPLPKPGDDLGLVPVLLMGGGDRRPNSSASSSSTSSLRYSPIGASHPPIQWTFADQIEAREEESKNLAVKIEEEKNIENSVVQPLMEELFLLPMEEILQKNGWLPSTL